jgi:hypothetical protein
LKLETRKWDWRDVKGMRVGGKENSFRSSMRITIRLLEMINNSDSSIPQAEMNKYSNHPIISRWEALNRHHFQ